MGVLLLFLSSLTVVVVDTKGYFINIMVHDA